MQNELVWSAPHEGNGELTEWGNGDPLSRTVQIELHTNWSEIPPLRLGLKWNELSTFWILQQLPLVEDRFPIYPIQPVSSAQFASTSSLDTAMVSPNVSPLAFESDLVLEDLDPLLGIQNEGRVNRPLVTQDHIGKTGFSAYLSLVQYGTYRQYPACLLALDFSFRFPNKGGARFSSAEIELTFEKALDADRPSVRSKDASLDPVVANFAPKTLLGQILTREHKTTHEIKMPVVFEAPLGPKVGVTTTFGGETTVTEEGRLEVHGNLAQDDDHDEGANSVTWDMTENPLKKDGILRSFRGVVILKVRQREAFWLHVSVKPVVKFSLDPKRLFTKRMRQERDEPILLDGQTPYHSCGDGKSLRFDEFDSSEFPWEEVLHLPPRLEAHSSESDTA